MRATVICALVLVLGLAGAAHAIPLNLVLDLPDVTSGFIEVSYEYGTFTAEGYALSLEINGIGGPDYMITDGEFNLTAQIDSDGVLEGGTLSITGTIPAYGAMSGTLLSGTITSFGYPDVAGGQVFEFITTNLSGDLASAYGTSAGTILGGTGFAGTFTQGFGNTGAGMADTAPVVPEPATLLLLSIGALGLVGRRSFRR